MISVKGDRPSRLNRCMKIVREIRTNPSQTNEDLMECLSISRSQLYKDKKLLEEMGFEFKYNAKTGFEIINDGYDKVNNLTPSDARTILFALQHLILSGDGHLASEALEVGKKLVVRLEDHLQMDALSFFNGIENRDTYGCDSNVLNDLKDAVAEKRQIKIFYQSSSNWEKSWREIIPLRLYYLQRTLYLYAKTAKTESEFKSYRVSRISSIQKTDMYFTELSDDGDFDEQLKNAFKAFIGPVAHQISVKFSGEAARFVSEGIWHHSQEIAKTEDGGVIFTVKVAEPQEVIWWSQQFGDEAVVLEI